MQSLADLKAGKLKGITQLKISENLSSFPLEIFDLAETLEVLDLSHNLLTDIPEGISCLKKLKIAFFSFNRLKSVPSSLMSCNKLYMLGLKANQIETFDEDILPLSISWLILTDNRLKTLPRSIGKLSKLQKFPLAGNQLSHLPEEMSQCKNLELLRLSANNLTEIPLWLLDLPKLSWLAFSGNPCATTPQTDIKEVHYEQLEVKELLGEGASGEIYKGFDPASEQDIAIKLFKGEITSDGYAKDEMNAYMSTGDHDHLIKVLAKIEGNKPLGLVLEFIPSHYQNLGFPPNFQTCTRDTFKEGITFKIETIESVVKAMLSASTHLHSKGLMHGDLYAHNILIDMDEDHCYLGDFGAASFYDKNNKKFEKLEVRAFGCLIDDLLQLSTERTSPKYKRLQELSDRCMHEDTQNRPFFSEISLA